MYWWFSFSFSIFYDQFYQDLLVRSMKLSTVVPENQNTMQRAFSDFSSAAKEYRHESLKRVWELGKCHTCTTTYTYGGTNGICLLAAAQLMNNYYKNHLSPGAFVPFKLCLRRKNSWLKRSGSLEGRGEFKGIGQVHLQHLVVFVRRLWVWTGGLVGARKKPWQIWSQQSVFAVFLIPIPFSCCH